MAALARGPFGEVLFPGAEEVVRGEAVVVHRAKAAFDDVARFYRDQYGAIKHVTAVDGQASGGEPCLAIAVGKRCTAELGFSALAVSLDPASKKKRTREVLIQVVAKPR